MKRAVLWLLLLVSFVGALWLGWTFRANNALAIDLDLVWTRIPEIELWRALALAFALGAFLATLLIGFAWLRARLLVRRYRSMVRRLEKEVHQLRSLPLVGSGPRGADLDTVGADHRGSPAAAGRG